jgi:hypothetical protein
MIRLRGQAARNFLDAVSKLRRACRYCSCTEHQACPGGCAWTGETLCSACTPDVDQTVTALCLVDGTEHITDDQVKAWTADQRADAFYWAMAVHQVARDNLVDVPARPLHTVADLDAHA